MWGWLSARVDERRRDNDMARAQTDAARQEYVKVLRHIAGRYAKNLRMLGEMASVRVEAEPRHHSSPTTPASTRPA